jgi:hypothetical protein
MNSGCLGGKCSCFFYIWRFTVLEFSLFNSYVYNCSVMEKKFVEIGLQSWKTEQASVVEELLAD